MDENPRQVAAEDSDGRVGEPPDAEGEESGEVAAEAAKVERALQFAGLKLAHANAKAAHDADPNPVTEEALKISWLAVMQFMAPKLVADAAPGAVIDTLITVPAEDMEEVLDGNIEDVNLTTTQRRRNVVLAADFAAMAMKQWEMTREPVDRDRAIGCLKSFLLVQSTEFSEVDVDTFVRSLIAIREEKLPAIPSSLRHRLLKGADCEVAWGLRLTAIKHDGEKLQELHRKMAYKLRKSEEKVFLLMRTEAQGPLLVRLSKQWKELIQIRAGRLRDVEAQIANILPENMPARFESYMDVIPYGLHLLPGLDDLARQTSALDVLVLAQFLRDIQLAKIPLTQQDAQMIENSKEEFLAYPNRRQSFVAGRRLVGMARQHYDVQVVGDGGEYEYPETVRYRLSFREGVVLSTPPGLLQRVFRLIQGRAAM